MAKIKNDMLPDIKQLQKLNPKVRKNSECSICECYFCDMKLKMIDGIPVIICKDCFSKIKGE